MGMWRSDFFAFVQNVLFMDTEWRSVCVCVVLVRRRSILPFFFPPAEDCLGATEDVWNYLCVDVFAG